MLGDPMGSHGGNWGTGFVVFQVLVSVVFGVVYWLVGVVKGRER